MKSENSKRPIGRGNFSNFHTRFQSVDYSIKKNDDGELIVGTHTRADKYFPDSVLGVIQTCWFKKLEMQSVIEHNGKEYGVTYMIFRYANHFGDNTIFRILVNTENDFDYDFPEL